MINEEEQKALLNRFDDEAVMMECQRLTGLPPKLTMRKIDALASAFPLRVAVPQLRQAIPNGKARFCAECGHKNQT